MLRVLCSRPNPRLNWERSKRMRYGPVLALLIAAVPSVVLTQTHAAQHSEEAWQALPLRDPSFEKLTLGPVAGPDWGIPSGPYGPSSWASVSDERARSGKQSLRIADPLATKGIFVRSQRFDVLPGSQYRASVYAFNETGNSRIYLEFFNRAGVRVANKLKQASKLGEWVHLEVEQTAPWTAVEVDVGLYSLVGNVGVAFYDDVAMRVQRLDLQPAEFTPLQPGEPAVRVGSALQFFADARIIGKTRGLGLKLHPPRRAEIALDMTQPWEGAASNCPVVLKDGDRYRMWYGSDAATGQMTAYAESDDGIRWRRPSLGLIEYKGAKDNNLVWPTQGNVGHNMSVFIDRSRSAPAAARYKAIMIGPKYEGKRDTFIGLVSADGIHWRHFQSDPILVASEGDSAFDSHNIAFWDDAHGQYVVYARGWREGMRAIRCATSKDFKTWPPLRYIDLGSTPAEHLYTNAAHPYFRQPSFYVMLPSRFVHDRKLSPAWPDGGISDVVLLTSHDGLRFDRTFMEAFIRPGLDPSNWTDRALYPGPSIVPIGTGDPPREMSFYCFESRRGSPSRIMRATLRVDGFASVHAGYPQGEFLTKPIVFEGKKLILNYATSAAGSIRVEIQNTAGKAIPMYRAEAGEELYGDELAHVYKWATAPDLAQCSGKPVRLRVIMQDSDLYSLRFGE